MIANTFWDAEATPSSVALVVAIVGVREGHNGNHRRNEEYHKWQHNQDKDKDDQATQARRADVELKSQVYDLATDLHEGMEARVVV